MGLKPLTKVGLGLAALLVMVGVFASVAYAATIHGTKNHDWGKARDTISNPPNCGARCGKMIHGTNAKDTIYGHEGWDYIGTFGGGDIVHGGLGMDVVQGNGGDDKIYGEIGHDHVFGGEGNDTIDLHDGRIERGNVEQASGDRGRDVCILDEDTRDGVIVNESCETLVLKMVPGQDGLTKVYNTHHAMMRNAPAHKYKPGTHHPG
jgi:hypothetical protein